MIKKIFFGLILILVAIQFIHPEKNESNVNTYGLASKYALTPTIENTLKSACYDCHSNKTEYPWYFNIQPVAWMLNDHVQEGKQHLNFSEFVNKPIAYQFHKLEECAELIEKKEMPLASYTYFGLHKDANLSDAQREDLIVWAKGICADIKANYPADSLIRKKRK